jgi:hypothetical protein
VVAAALLSWLGEQDVRRSRAAAWAASHRALRRRNFSLIFTRRSTHDLDASGARVCSYAASVLRGSAVVAAGVVTRPDKGC